MKPLQNIFTAIFGVLSCLSFLGGMVTMCSQPKHNYSIEALNIATHNSLILGFTGCGILFSLMFLLSAKAKQL